MTIGGIIGGTGTVPDSMGVGGETVLRRTVLHKVARTAVSDSPDRCFDPMARGSNVGT
jgi:hypothetical protein